jgi:hypothetical protein
MATEERSVRRLPKNISLVQSIHALNHLELMLVISAADMGDAILPVPELADLVDTFVNTASCKKLRAVRRGQPG